VKIKDDHIKVLDEYGASVQAVYRSPDRVFGEIRMKSTGQQVLREEGPNEQDAVAAAIERLRTMPKPKTPAEIADENAKLAAESERLRNELDALKAATASAKPNRPPASKEKP
jgi:hypothetical protein